MSTKKKDPPPKAICRCKVAHAITQREREEAMLALQWARQDKDAKAISIALARLEPCPCVPKET